MDSDHRLAATCCFGRSHQICHKACAQEAEEPEDEGEEDPQQQVRGGFHQYHDLMVALHGGYSSACPAKEGGRSHLVYPLLCHGCLRTGDGPPLVCPERLQVVILLPSRCA